MKFLMTLLVLVLFQPPMMAGETSPYAMAKAEAYKMEEALGSYGVTMNQEPNAPQDCPRYRADISKGMSFRVLDMIEGVVERYGAGPNVPKDSASIVDQARRWAQDKTETMEDPVMHPYKLQQWRIHLAMVLERCGTGDNNTVTLQDLEGAYWLYRAAHVPPAYLRVARTIMEKMPRENDEQVRWICRQIDGRIDRKADICDTMDITGGLGPREAKR